MSFSCAAWRAYARHGEKALARPGLQVCGGAKVVGRGKVGAYSRVPPQDAVRARQRSDIARAPMASQPVSGCSELFLPRHASSSVTGD